MASLVVTALAFAASPVAVGCGKYGKPVRAKTTNGDSEVAQPEEPRSADPDPHDAFEPIFDETFPAEETDDGENP
jgi:hypothetical protein